MTTSFIYELATSIENLSNSENTDFDAVQIVEKVVAYFADKEILYYSYTHSKYFVQLSALNFLDAAESALVSELAPLLPQRPDASIEKTSMIYEKYIGAMKVILSAIQTILMQQGILEEIKEVERHKIPGYQMGFPIGLMVSFIIAISSLFAFSVTNNVYETITGEQNLTWGYAVAGIWGVISILVIFVFGKIPAISEEIKGYKVKDELIKKFYLNQKNLS